MGFFCSPLKPQFLPLRKSYKKSDFLHDRYETQQQVHDLWVIKVYSRRELQWRKENPCCLKACVSDRYQPCSPALLRSQVTTGNAGIKTGNQSKDEITPVAFSQLLGGGGQSGGSWWAGGGGGVYSGNRPKCATAVVVPKICHKLVSSFQEKRAEKSQRVWIIHRPLKHLVSKCHL